MLLHGFRQPGFTLLHELNATDDDDAGTDPGSTLMLVHAPSTATSQRRGSGAARQAFTREVHRWGHNVDIFRTSSCYSTVVLVLRVEPSGVEDTVSIECVPYRLPDEITVGDTVSSLMPGTFRHVLLDPLTQCCLAPFDIRFVPVCSRSSINVEPGSVPASSSSVALSPWSNVKPGCLNQQQGRVDLSRTPAPREAVEPFQIHVAFGCGGTERLDHNAARHLCVHTEEARVRNEEVGHRVLIELLQDELAIVE